MVLSCYLVRRGQERVCLPDGEVTYVGRSPVWGIQEPSCSRKQLSVKPDIKKRIAYVTRLGDNSSGVNGFDLPKDEIIPIPEGSQIEVLLDDCVYELKFMDSKVQNDNLSTQNVEKTSKRTRSPDNVIVDNAKKANIEMTAGTPNSGQMKKNLKETSAETFEDIDAQLLYILTTKGVVSSEKIAAYDLDNTIIKTKSGKVFPKDTDDWQLAFPEIPGKLKQYSSDGYKIVFFTNQAGIGNKKLKVEDFKKKLQNIFRRLGVPGQAFISPGKGIYRKPAMGMWDTLIHMKNDDIEIDMTKSFYCGDAAGRPKDHSLADRLFAENIGLPFCTPEHHFGGRAELSYNKPSFDPKDLDKNAQLPDLTSDKQEVIVLVGFPGSGKSHISSKLTKVSKGRYKAVCRDVLGSWQKCVAEASKYIKSGKSVIADSTNPDKDSRGRWVTLAKENGIPCRCIEMDVSLSHAFHNNRFRQLTDTTHSYVADVIFHSYKKKYEKPETSEGFRSVLKVPFVVDFSGSQHEDLYFKHLLEK